MRKFRLSPSVAVLAARGAAESRLVADLDHIAAVAQSPAAKATVARLAAADGAYDDVDYRFVQAVYAHANRLVVRLDKTVGAAFAHVQGIVTAEAAAAQQSASADEAAWPESSDSAKRAMALAFALGLALIVFFGVVIARISRRLDRARVAEFETMAQMASTDPLTGLRNHRAFHEDLEQARHASRGPTPLSLVMLDLDDLKTVNDQLGHQAGDARLRSLATAIRHAAGDNRALVHSEEELKMLVTASQEAGVLEEHEEQMLHRVFGFSDLTAGQVMIPRTELVAVAADTPLTRCCARSARASRRACRSTARIWTTSSGCST